ncbi:hypothetical protein ACOSP7_018511 [Xanthoceras sorbifolium]
MNVCVHGGQGLNSLDLWSWTGAFVLNFQQSCSSSYSLVVGHCWRPLDTGFKINIDAALDVKTEQHSVATVIRNSNGLHVTGVAKCFKGFGGYRSGRSQGYS